MTTASEILALVEGSPVVPFAPGSILIAEGDHGGVLYILDSGTLEILKGGHPISRVNQRGAVFGEVSVLLDQPHMATVRAASEGRWWRIENPRGWLNERPQVALHVATTLARRLSAVTSYLVDLKRQYEDRQDHLGMVDEVLESLLQMQARPGRRGPSRDKAATDLQ